MTLAGTLPFGAREFCCSRHGIVRANVESVHCCCSRHWSLKVLFSVKHPIALKMLVLAVHNLNETSAKIPFSMVVLLECVSKKLHPPDFRCRQIVPTSGLRSVSLWDAPSLEALREWLDELMESDCKSEVFEVQEQFAVGLFADVHRAADEVSAKTREVGSAASAQFGKLDERFKIQQQAQQAMKVAGDLGSTAAKNVAQTFKSVSSKAMENEKVATAAQTTAQAWRGMTDKVATSFKSFDLGGSIWPAAGGAAASDSPSARAQQATGLQPDADPQRVGNTSPVTPAAPATAPAAPKPTATATGSSGALAAATRPSVPAAAPSTPNQSEFFSLGDEEDASPAPIAATGAAAGNGEPNKTAH